MSDEQLKIMAAAVYEIRCLLTGHLGSTCDSDADVRLAAHLSYALHNQALEVIEGDGTFDPDVARASVRAAEGVVGSRYSDGFGVFGVGEDA